MTIFKDKAKAVQEMKRDRLLAIARPHLSCTELDNDYVYDKLLAAESEVSHELRVSLEPRTYFPDDPTQEQIDALGGGAWGVDPAYDYDPDFFQGEKWGFIITRNKPIIEVTRIRFAYPAPTNDFFDIPLEWLRMDKKYGHIRMVPASKAFSAPLSAFLMQALGGGRTIPHMIQVYYRAGLSDVQRDYPDLVDVIKRLAVLKVLEDRFVPQSGSISADGLSRSISVDMGKYQEMIEYKLHGPPGSNGGLMAAIHGVRGLVMG